MGRDSEPSLRCGGTTCWQPALKARLDGRTDQMGLNHLAAWTVYMWWDLGKGREYQIKDVYCLMNRDRPSEKRKMTTPISALLSCKCSYIISVHISSIYLHGNEYWTFFHLQSKESSTLMLPGQCALGWLASTLWHLHLTDRLIIGWLNKSCPLGIDFCPRQMIYV